MLISAERTTRIEHVTSSWCSPLHASAGAPVAFLRTVEVFATSVGRDQFVALLKPATRNDVMVHVLAGLTATDHAG
jgi:hypothetical protein